MYILRHLTQQFGTRLALRSFNVHRLGSSINHVCGCLHQESNFSVFDNQNGLCSKYMWSRSYTSQISTNFKVVLERLKVRNVPHVEVALESADFKKHILDLVSYYYGFESQTGQKSVERSMSIVDLYQIHVRRVSGFVPQVREHLFKSDSFKKLLETLPDHVENISIGDQLDIYMGLILLGVEETNLSMNHLFCNFHKTDSMLGLSELAKIRLLFFGIRNSKWVFSSIYTPNLQYLLKNNCIQTQEDCKNLALILVLHEDRFMKDRLLYFNQIFLYAVHSNLNDIDFILKIVNAFFSSKIKDFAIYRNLNIIMNQLEPEIEILPISKIVDFLAGIRTKSFFYLHQNYSRIFKDLCTKVVFCFEGVFTGDLPLAKKVDYLFTVARLYSVNSRILTHEHINKMLLFITEKTPDAEFAKVHFFIHTLRIFQSEQKVKVVLNSLTNRILEILKSQPTFVVLIDGISITECLSTLIEVSPFWLNRLYYEFAPYITWYIESGHACCSFHFCKISKFAIPILGYNMPPVADQRLRNEILWMPDNEHTFNWIYLDRLVYIFQGALLGYNTEQGDYADSIIRLIATTYQHHRFLTKSLIYFLQRVNIGFIQGSSISDFKKAIADQMVIDENHLDDYTSRNMIPFISEKNANTLLSYFALAYFNGNYVGQKWSYVLFNLILMFVGMSRYPKDKDLLKNLSKHILEKYFHNLPIHTCYSILQALCSLDIYLDKYLQMVFSQEYLKKMDDYLGRKSSKKKKINLAVFEKLNREVALHCQELNIPWRSNAFASIASQFNSDHLQETVEFDEVRMHLKEVLGESALLITHGKADYGINIDFEFYLDSSNKPIGYRTAKYHSKSDIQKIAVIIGRKTHQEYLAEDPKDPSVYNTNMIKDLNVLGYKAVLIQGHEWNFLLPEERFHFLKEKIFENEMK